MQKYNRFFVAIAVMILLFLLCACTAESVPLPAQPDADAGAAHVLITFDYEKQSGYASNQFAVWIENGEGELIRTLYATRFTAKGGYQNRPDAIPTWVKKADLQSMQAAEVDVITGATPKSEQQAFIWDLKDHKGDKVPNGEYTFFVEGSLRWKNRVIFSGVISVGDEPVTVQADAEYIYEASDDQPALAGGSPENAMISGVTVEYAPAA